MKSRTFKLNKLVRDKIVQSTIEQGGAVDYQSLKGKEFTNALVVKLIEEAKELQGNQLSAEELADLQEIIDQLCRSLKITAKQLKDAQLTKKHKNGGFEKGHFIDTLTLPNDNKWTDYYAADPKRFPEVRKIK